MNGPGRPRCTVIICSIRGEHMLPVSLGSLYRNEHVEFEAVVVDNGALDRTAEVVRTQFPQVRLISTGRNLGFAGGNNVGFVEARGRDFVLLNDDTELPPDFLASILAPLDRDPRIGAVGCKLYYPGGRTLQHAGAVVRANANTDHVGYGEQDTGQYDEPRECAYVTGAALALRREALEQVGLFDPEFFPTFFEELDLLSRLRAAGWKVWYEPRAWLTHFESQSQGVASRSFYFRYTRNRMRYLALHGLPGPVGAALREELRWFARVVREGNPWLSVVRAYAWALWHAPGWLSDRRARRSVARLPAADA